MRRWSEVTEKYSNCSLLLISPPPVRLPDPGRTCVHSGDSTSPSGTPMSAYASNRRSSSSMYRDLNELYERTKREVRIAHPRGGDRPYVASRFKQ